MQRMIISWNRVNNVGPIPSVDTVCNLGAFVLFCERDKDTASASDRKALVWLGACVVTVTLDTVRYGAPEEIRCGPRVSDQWANSSRKTNIRTSGMAAALAGCSVITPIVSPVEAVLKCQLTLFFFCSSVFLMWVRIHRSPCLLLSCFFYFFILLAFTYTEINLKSELLVLEKSGVNGLRSSFPVTSGFKWCWFIWSIL